MDPDFPSAIGRLTGLVSLRLEVQRFCEYDAVFVTPTMAPLTRLTELGLINVILGRENGVQPETIEGLPLSLQKFKAPICCSGCLDLTRLTALTELTLEGGDIDDGDLLPPACASWTATFAARGRCWG